MPAMILAPFSLVLAAVPASGMWDVAADFNTNSNAAGNVWTYGRIPYNGGNPDPSGFVLYDQAGKVVDPNAPFAWQDGPSPSVDTLGAVSFNESAQFKTFFGIDWEPMEVDLVPDQGKVVVSAARFTAPQDGSFAVHAEFADNQSCCANREGDAWVLSDSETLFHVAKLPASDGVLTHATGTARVWEIYDGVVDLSAGDSVYFASGKGDSGGDHVVLRATLDLASPPVPLEITAVAYDEEANEISLTFNSLPDRPYILEFSTDLIAWRELRDDIVGTGPSTTVTDDTFDPGPQNFFRIREF